MNSLSTRSIAEHFCTLATLLEAEALRLDAIRLQSTRDLYQEAVELRSLADRLWKLDTTLTLPAAPEPPADVRHAAPASLRRADRFHPAQPAGSGTAATLLRHVKGSAVTHEGRLPTRVSPVTGAMSPRGTASENNAG